jgi:hypothetical protein
MEKEEEEGHLPFLDTDIYRKPDSSLGHRVYWKPTHTNPYLHQDSYHHSQKTISPGFPETQTQSSL